jgi:hypothetical protein
MVDGLLALQPLDQRPHAVLEGHPRRIAEQLFGAGDVGVAVADVPGAVLAVELGLDLGADAIG